MRSRRRRDPYTRTIVRLPERDLADSILHLAAPLLDASAAKPAEGDTRKAIELAIDVWNAHVGASEVWDAPNPKALSALRKSMCGRGAPAALRSTFELLSARWRKEFALDPRLVGAWTLEIADGRPPNLVCEMLLPEGLEAHVPPPAEKRISIGGMFLDEVQIRIDATSYLGFPVEAHRGTVGEDGGATIWTKMPTALQLFASKRLLPVGGDPVEISIGLNQLGPMVLIEVRSSGGYGHDIAMLVFRPAQIGGTPRVT